MLTAEASKFLWSIRILSVAFSISSISARNLSSFLAETSMIRPTLWEESIRHKTYHNALRVSPRHYPREGHQAMRHTRVRSSQKPEPDGLQDLQIRLVFGLPDGGMDGRSQHNQQIATKA
jgi:hypothetical protein